MGDDSLSSCRGLCFLLLQLVGTGFAYLGSGGYFVLHLVPHSRLYLSLDGWRMDESSAEK